jgi:hypothetical protein
MKIDFFDEHFDYRRVIPAGFSQSIERFSELLSPYPRPVRFIIVSVFELRMLIHPNEDSRQSGWKNMFLLSLFFHENGRDKAGRDMLPDQRI